MAEQREIRTLQSRARASNIISRRDASPTGVSGIIQSQTPKVAKKEVAPSAPRKKKGNKRTSDLILPERDTKRLYEFIDRWELRTRFEVLYWACTESELVRLDGILESFLEELEDRQEKEPEVIDLTGDEDHD